MASKTKTFASGKTRITTEVDFSADGKQVGYLRLPHSVHRSAYGYLAIPIAVIKNGRGPTLYVQSGNHGDEYEGQVANAKLIRRLQPRDVRGRVIVVPMANFPAAAAGTRTSPIDQGNLNRMFPGHPDGTPTLAIAHYIENVLMTMADAMVDLHSGGSSLNYIPSALAKMRGDKKLDGKLVEMLDAFAAPISYCIHGPGDDRTISGAAERVGLPAIGTELGGAGTVNIQGTRAAEDGTQRLLEYLGIVKETKLSKNRPTTRFMDLAGVDYYVYASDRGLFEPYVDLGATVKKGQPAGAIHFMDDPLREPKVVSFRRDGVVLCKRIPGQVERGDCVFHLGTDRK